MSFVRAVEEWAVARRIHARPAASGCWRALRKGATLRHADGRGVLRLWREGGRILWLIHQLCDLVQVRSSDDGTLVRMHMSR